MNIVAIFAAVCALMCASAVSAEQQAQICYNQFEPPLDHLRLGCYNYSLSFLPSGFPKPSDPQVLSPKFIVHASANNFELAIDAKQKFGQDIALPIRPGSKVVFLAHGALSDHGHPFVSDTQRDLLALEDPDLIVITISWPRGSGKENQAENWPEARLGKIRRAASNSRIIGALTADFVKFLKQDERYAPSHVHCIGFSVGAHLCGFAGKRYQELTNGADKFDRITGLDPATPVFKHTKSSKEHLWHTDAKLVDVLHTNTLLLGMSRQLGHIDFYLGDGVAKYGEGQPGCLAGTFSTIFHTANRLVGREPPSMELEDVAEQNQDGSFRLDTTKDEARDEKSSDERSTIRKWWDSIGVWMGNKKSHWFVHCSHQRAWQYFGNSIRRDCQYSSQLVDGRSVEMGYFLKFDPQAGEGDREYVRMALSQESPNCQKKAE